MCNERNHSICYTTTTYEVHIFKNKNKSKSLRDIFYHFFSLLNLSIRSCKFVLTESRAYDIAHDENALSSKSKYIIGSGLKQPPMFYKKKLFSKNFEIFTGKYLCWSLFLIKNFKATLLIRNWNTGVILWILQNFLKITYFEEHLQTGASIIRCYFDKINLKQSGFCTTYFFKILDSERKYKNNIKKIYFAILI